MHDAANGNTMSVPYGLAIDNSGNVWVSNAGCVTRTATLCTPGPLVLSELIGAAGPTITPIAAQDGSGLTGFTPGVHVNPANGHAEPGRRSARRDFAPH